MLKKPKGKIYPILIILLVAVGAVFFWYWQRNIYSKDIIKLEILGPASADFAKEFEYTVKYKNNGNVRLEEAKLIFEYPKNAIVDNGAVWQEIPLEDIYPGEEKTVTFKARLIGQEGETETAKASLSYRPKNLKARYESDTSFTTQVKSLPLTFEFDLPSKIESSKDFKFRLNYFSNIDYPLLNLRITAEYPVGFEFISSNPNSLEKIEWELPPLNKAEGGRIEITGRIQGEVGEQKMFSAKLGIWKDGEFILLKEIARGVEIIKPALRITQQINGNADYVANPGDQLHYEIFFRNLGESALSNLTLVDTLVGDIFDLQTLQAPTGKFTMGDNSIIWDWRTFSSLQFLGPGEEGKIDFWVKLKADFEVPSANGNLTVRNDVNLGQVGEEFTTKVNSKLEIVQKGFFQDEIFGNSGPIPPRAGQTTTYTISWQAKNYYNEVKNVKVKTILPQNVQLTGKIFPEDSRMTFDSQSREIVWEAGDLRVGQGVLNLAPNVSFQVSFLPASSQIGQAPDIIGQSKISGEDSWTNETVEGVSSGINTTLPDDPSIDRQGTVR
ncbi:MAG: hypothetical protein V1756_01060 [Patescibacteria group bacterium]